MRVPKPTETAHLFAPINDALVKLLRELTPEQWDAPTVAGSWTVREVAAHLLDTTLRRLSMDRDGFTPPLPPDAFAGGFTAFIDNLNREGVSVLRRLSPAVMIDLHERHGRQMAEFFSAKDPHAAARWSVSWAGEEVSENWFDIARELTERWHHQQQIRDAVGAAPLHEFLPPVLDTFVRALPHTYRDLAAPDGTTLVLRIVDEASARWTLAREQSRWTLYEDEPPSYTTRVTLRGDVAWRLFTKQKIDPRAVIEGDAELAKPLLGMIAIIG